MAALAWFERYNTFYSRETNQKANCDKVEAAAQLRLLNVIKELSKNCREVNHYTYLLL